MKKTMEKCCTKVWRLWKRSDNYPRTQHPDTPTQSR